MFWHPLRCLFFLFSPRTDPCSGMMVGSIYFIVFESSTVRELLGKVFHVAEPIWCDTLHCEFGHFDAIVTLVFSSYASPIAIHEENFSKLNTVLPKKMRSFLRSHLRFFFSFCRISFKVSFGCSLGVCLKFCSRFLWSFISGVTETFIEFFVRISNVHVGHRTASSRLHSAFLVRIPCGLM